jgi:ankyrin repeat protein
MGATDPLLEAIKARDPAAVRRLLDSGSASFPPAEGSGEPPLLTAIYVRSQEIIDLLIARGAAPDLFEAAALGDIPRLRTLLGRAPESLASHSFDGWTALHLAAHYGQLEAMETLLAAGAGARARSANDLRNTPLHAALAGGQRAAAEVLLRAGADANAADAEGHAPLHLAAEDGNALAIRLLLDHGADPRARNRKGETPLDFAERPGKEAAADLLRQAGAGG